MVIYILFSRGRLTKGREGGNIPPFLLPLPLHGMHVPLHVAGESQPILLPPSIRGPAYGGESHYGQLACI